MGCSLLLCSEYQSGGGGGELSQVVKMMINGMHAMYDWGNESIIDRQLVAEYQTQKPVSEFVFCFLCSEYSKSTRPGGSSSSRLS